MSKQPKEAVLHVFIKPNIFKLYFSDCGLLGGSCHCVVRWVGEGGQPVDDLYPLLSTQPSSGTSFDPSEDSRRGACGL